MAGACRDRAKEKKHEPNPACRCDNACCQATPLPMLFARLSATLLGRELGTETDAVALRLPGILVDSNPKQQLYQVSTCITAASLSGCQQHCRTFFNPPSNCEKRPRFLACTMRCRFQDHIPQRQVKSNIPKFTIVCTHLHVLQEGATPWLNKGRQQADQEIATKHVGSKFASNKAPQHCQSMPLKASEAHRCKWALEKTMRKNARPEGTPQDLALAAVFALAFCLGTDFGRGCLLSGSSPVPGVWPSDSRGRFVCLGFSPASSL